MQCVWGGGGVGGGDCRYKSCSLYLKVNNSEGPTSLQFKFSLCRLVSPIPHWYCSWVYSSLTSCMQISKSHNLFPREPTCHRSQGGSNLLKFTKLVNNRVRVKTQIKWPHSFPVLFLLYQNMSHSGWKGPRTFKASFVLLGCGKKLISWSGFSFQRKYFLKCFDCTWEINHSALPDYRTIYIPNEC